MRATKYSYELTTFPPHVTRRLSTAFPAALDWIELAATSNGQELDWTTFSIKHDRTDHMVGPDGNPTPELVEVFKLQVTGSTLNQDTPREVRTHES